MPVPKKRSTVMKRGFRRSHHALSRSYATICTNCGEPVLPHRVCMSCGYYRGKPRVEIQSAAS